jgi:excisionase family DNA binding protein
VNLRVYVKKNFALEVARMATQLVSLGRAAEELQVSRDTLRRLAAKGELKTIRISRMVLVPTSEILRIVEGGVGRYAGQKPAEDGKPK